MTDFAAFTAFTSLHRATTASPLLLPNAWDRASATALCQQGFPAIGTTSLAVAAAAGLSDGTGATRAETVLLARRLGAGPYLLSVDAEGGFSDDPAEVAELAREPWPWRRTSGRAGRWTGTYRRTHRCRT
ncbi:isocitrate lyase/phosphoenolpyruvate mutase family protein [Streptomyces sp. NPDC004044]